MAYRLLRVALPSPPSARSARLQLARRACSTLVLSVRASVAPAAQWLRRAERFSTLRTSTRSSDGMITTESWFVARYRGATSLGPGDNRDHVMPISRGAPTRLSTHPCHSISLENQGSPASQLTCFAGLSGVLHRYKGKSFGDLLHCATRPQRACRRHARRWCSLCWRGESPRRLGGFGVLCHCRLQLARCACSTLVLSALA